MDNSDSAVFGRDDRSSTTESMASLLLSGWAMMSETCTECHSVPLMRSRDGILKCCGCNREFGGPSRKSQSVDMSTVPAASNTSSGMRIDHHKYRIVEECGLESGLLSDIHGAGGDRALPKNVNLHRPTVVAPVEGRRLQQLCLLRVELTKALDRYIALLHECNENGSMDSQGECTLFDRIERILRLFEMVDSRL
ncbi:uncharacterized protein BBOV_IV006750 [Babesia bovis T2Bo]|uniref:Uncharacterized protein n=1 Tax=Babesia bovis TaxID=5865 RepID=A7AR62_BABBO|nr:uncharacterized protein BBOV_IV006750 [Babesia bovis T2Bo]EDO07031.1 hypothetical protein BBOV_IV006750 [Babesia bovis T2Bo]|eukprot:XP_001610599.1 hypothetical protein [Babesia bovis T2Bo]